MTERPGFTLIELLVVMVMTAIFAGFAVIISVPTIRNGEFDRVRETIRSELVTAQADTIGGTLNSSWGVAFSSSTVTRYRGVSYATRNVTFDRVTSFGNGVIISGTADVAFTRPRGLPLASATIVMTNGILNATTTVHTTGAIDVQ